MVADFVRLTGIESTIGFPLDDRARRTPPRLPVDPAGLPLSARAAFDAVLRRALRRGDGPAYVLFSGGRDSSAVLAAATAVARADGLPDPVPLIGRHAGIPEADETEWQHLVLAHLGLPEPMVLDFADEQHWLGPVALAALDRHGLVWPATVQLLGSYFDRIPRGSVVLTGEGGDHVLSPTRITPLALALRKRRPPSRGLARAAAGALVPAPAAARVEERRLRRETFSDWLVGEARRTYAHELAQQGREPLRWDRAVWQAVESRSHRVVFANLDAAGSEYAVDLVHPFVDPVFRVALGHQGGVWGARGRTHLMRLLFADVLPDALLARDTKAAFNLSRWGEVERDFARSWTGEGVDADLVDVETLRGAWLGPRPNAACAYLLHAAWTAVSAPREVIALPLARDVEESA